VIILNNQLVTEDETDDLFTERMQEWLALTPEIPFGIYECPVPYKRLVSIPVLEQLLETGRLVYHKDTSLKIDEVRAKLKTGENYVFGLYDAYIEHAMDSLSSGAKGLSCIQGNYFPDLIVKLCAAPEKHAEIQEFFSAHMELMHQSYPTSAKYVLQKMGFPINLETRRKVAELTPEIKLQLDALIEEYHARF
jgi:4-hydroxy-tetrahydrodipicolinate synthase